LIYFPEISSKVWKYKRRKGNEIILFPEREKLGNYSFPRSRKR
jgi:hypothetical protein